MDKQYATLPDLTWERTNSGDLFRSVTSSMPGKFHFNLLIIIWVSSWCGGGGGGGGQFSEASCCVTNIIVVCVFLVLYGGSGSNQGHIS